MLVESECGHCGQALHIEMDSELQWRVAEAEAEAEPLVYVPLVDLQNLAEPSIIDCF